MSEMGVPRGEIVSEWEAKITEHFQSYAITAFRPCLGRGRIAHKVPEPKAKVGSEVHERLCRARAFINERYHEPIDLDEISREACLSRYHFLRLFREEFATTPHQYLIDRRIEKAKELLRHRRLTVTDVCFEVGFQSLGSFSTLFRQRVGDAPVNYRQQQREAQSKIPTCFLEMYGLGVKD